MEKVVKMMLWWENVKASLRNEKGQGMVEYGLILAFVAVAALVALTAMGGSVGDKFTAIKNSLTGAAPASPQQ